MEEAGIERWIAAQARTRPPAEAAELAADVVRAQRLRALYRALISATRDRLATLYASAASDDEKRAEKAAAFAEMRAAYERQKTTPDGAGISAALDRWFAAGANNAGIAAVGLYADRVPQFGELLKAEDGDFPRFYSRVKALAALPKAERELALVAAARRFQ